MHRLEMSAGGLKEGEERCSIPCAPAPMVIGRVERRTEKLVGKSGQDTWKW